MSSRTMRLGTLLQTFLERYLPIDRNLSPNTILSYRDGLLLFIHFAARALGKDADRIRIEQIDVSLVRRYLEWLAKSRHCKARTVNQRLASLKAFLVYVASVAPEHLDRCRVIREIRARRVAHEEPRFLESEEVNALFQASASTRSAMRDRALLALLYNSGARVQEVVNLNVGDLVMEAPPRVRLVGKGRKERTCPLWGSTVRNLRQMLAQRSAATVTAPLFLNQRGSRITRSGVAYVLTTLARKAKLARGGRAVRVGPHVIRHTTAMHLLRSGVDMVVIAAWLGHADVSTTHGYVEIDLRMKQAAVAGASLPHGRSPRRFPTPNLVARLKAIGRGQPDGPPL